MSKIVLIGFDHVIGKLRYFYDFGETKNVQTIYASSDSGNITKSFDKGDIYYLPKGIKKFLTLYELIKKEKPNHIEIYFDRLDDILYAYLISIILNIELVSVCRGSEISQWEKHKFIRKFIMKMIFYKSKVIFIKELYMKTKILNFINITDTKLIQINNIVENKHFNNKFNKNSKNIIYINAFRKMRNLNLLIMSFIKFNQENNNQFNLILIGSTLENKDYSPSSNSYEIEIQKLIEQYDIAKKIQVLPFSTNPWENIDEALLFVLPADIVWLNNALLEAMAKGVVPIISNVEGSDKIVKDKQTGFICERDEQSLINILQEATLDKEKLQIISNECVNYTRDTFNIEVMYSIIYNSYKKKVWNNE